MRISDWSSDVCSSDLSGRNENVHYRPRWGAFHNTPLEAKLREQEITTLVICGFSFSTGGRASVYEASARDFRIVLVADALCNATDEAVQELGRMGVYLDRKSTRLNSNH